MTTTSFNKQMHSGVTSLKSDLGRVRTDLNGLASTVFNRGYSTVAATGQGIRRRAEGSLHNVQGRIQDRPFASTLIALGAGLCLGSLIKRR